MDLYLCCQLATKSHTHTRARALGRKILANRRVALPSLAISFFPSLSVLFFSSHYATRPHQQDHTNKDIIDPYLPTLYHTYVCVPLCVSVYPTGECFIKQYNHLWLQQQQQQGVYYQNPVHQPASPALSSPPSATVVPSRRLTCGERWASLAGAPRHTHWLRY